MKKYILMFIALFFFGFSSVQAADTLLCVYEGTTKDLITTNTTIYVYYSSSRDDFYIRDGYMGTVYYFTDDSVHLQDSSVYPNLEKLKCPDYAYKDSYLFDEFCFENGSGAYCKLAYNDWTTTFSGDSELTENFSDKLSATINGFSYSVSINALTDLEELTNGELLKGKIETAMDEYLKNNFDDVKNADNQDNLLARIKTSDVYSNKVYSEIEKVSVAVDNYLDDAEQLALDDPVLGGSNLATLETINSYREANNALKAWVEEEIKSGSLNTTIVTQDSTCVGYLGDGSEGTPKYYLDFAFSLIKYVGLVLLLVLTIVDYAKAVASNVDDAIKKASQNTLKRAIIVVVLFVLPVLIDFVLKILGLTSGTCGVG